MFRFEGIEEAVNRERLTEGWGEVRRVQTASGVCLYSGAQDLRWRYSENRSWTMIQGQEATLIVCFLYLIWLWLKNCSKSKGRCCEEVGGSQFQNRLRRKVILGLTRRSKQQQILAGYYCIPKAAFLSNANNAQVSNKSNQINQIHLFLFVVS